MSWTARKCIRIDTNEKCTEGYHLGNTVTYIQRKPRDVFKEQAEGPTARGVNTRGERDITKEATTQGDGAGITTSQGTPET